MKEKQPSTAIEIPTTSIFAIYLGGKHPKANIELHDLVVTTGNSIEDCFEYCRQNWFANELSQSKNKIIPHIDGYFQVELLNNHSNNGEYSLYIMNYGGYLPNQLAEMHEFATVFAKDKSDAIKRSKKLLNLNFKLLHMDNCLNIDDVIDLSNATGYKFTSPEPKDVIISLRQDYHSI